VKRIVTNGSIEHLYWGVPESFKAKLTSCSKYLEHIAERAGGGENIIRYKNSTN
jgi:hypothetical protein